MSLKNINSTSFREEPLGAPRGRSRKLEENTDLNNLKSTSFREEPLGAPRGRLRKLVPPVQKT